MIAFIWFCHKSIDSLLRHTHLQHIKKRIWKIRTNISSHIQKYTREGKSIVTISKEANYPPYMMARLFVEHMHKNFNGKKGGSKKYITDAVRDPEKYLNRPPEDFLRPEYWYSEKVAPASKDSLVRFVICVCSLMFENIHHSGLLINSNFPFRKLTSHGTTKTST